MLHCNMNTSPSIQLVLEDLLADLHHARRNTDLGRLALLGYCEVRNWARLAGKPDIAEWATRMFTENPCVSRDEFLEKIDTLIAALEHHQQPAVAPAGPFAQADASSGCHRAH
jgi:hypothetical protein